MSGDVPQGEAAGNAISPAQNTTNDISALKKTAGKMLDGKNQTNCDGHVDAKGPRLTGSSIDGEVPAPTAYNEAGSDTESQAGSVAAVSRRPSAASTTTTYQDAQEDIYPVETSVTNGTNGTNGQANGFSNGSSSAHGSSAHGSSANGSAGTESTSNGLPPMQPFKSPSFSVGASQRARASRHSRDSIARRSVVTSATGTSSIDTDQRGYNETSTIQIPEAYEKTEPAKASGRDEGDSIIRSHHPTRSKLVKPLRSEQKKRFSEKYVIPGEQVQEGHEDYALAYNMITGIRVSVSKCSQFPKPLTAKDYTQTTKMVFSWEGSPTTPSSKYEFKFKDYAPEVFRDLRSLFHIDQADYLLSLTEKVALTELGSPGKSGSRFYYSKDYRFIIKTIHHAEHRHLLRILKQYHDYVQSNRDTLLCQFYGLHRVKMMGDHGPIKVHFVVMNNIFPPSREIDERFDLKGSTYGRYTDVEAAARAGKKSVCLKDVNMLRSGEKVHLGPSARDRILKQIHNDVDFLESANTMDYSLLLGIHNMTEEELEAPDGSTQSDFMSTRDPETSKIFLLPDGGVRAATMENKQMPIIYYMSIIDCLTNYGFIKHLETGWRSYIKGEKRSTISAVPPVVYGKRFYKFMEKAMTPDSKKGKKD